MRRKGRILIALWSIAALLAVGVVLGASRLWSGKSKSSSAVAGYIKSVDAVQQQMRLPLTRLMTVYRSFSSSSNDPAQLARLASVESTLRTLEKRLAALPAPTAAARLRALIARLVRAEEGVAAEIDQLARFMPRFRAATTLVALANRQLGSALAAAPQPKAHLVHGTPKQVAAAKAAFAAAASRAAAAQADAVDAYDGVLARVLAGLRTMHPPALMAPAYRVQLTSLTATRDAGAALARGLRAVKRASVAVLGRRFTEASRLAGSVAAQRAEIAAITRYNARVRALGAIQASIRSELSRLQSTLA